MSQANFDCSTTTRRSLIGGSAATVVTGTAFADFTARRELDALYAERTALAAKSRDMNRDYGIALASLPWWAAPGPKYVRGDGSWRGPNINLPAINNGTLPNQPNYMRNKRPSLSDIRKDRDIALQYHPEAQRAAIRANYRRRVLNLVARLRRQRDEKRKARLPEIEGELNAISQRIGEVEERLENLIVGRMDAAQKAAALAIIAACHQRSHDDSFGDAASLNALRPLLKGPVREHVECVIANPDCEMSKMPFWAMV